MTPDRAHLKRLEAEVRAQSEKYDAAVAAGLTGAPLVQIDRKLVRLEYELEKIFDTDKGVQA